MRAFEAYRSAYLAGSPPERNEFLKQYPSIADKLADAIDALYRLRPLGAPGSEGAESGASAHSADHSRKTLGSYLLIRQIGQGAMGVVYEAEDVLLNRRVALKLTHDALLSEADRKRFRREASIAASLHHTHIVSIFTIGEEYGQFFYAMQLIEGGSLDRWSQGSEKGCGDFMASLAAPGGTTLPEQAAELADSDGQEPVDADPAPLVRPILTQRSGTGFTKQSDSATEYARTIAGIGIAIADALEYAHGKGVKHYDVKPGNVLIDAQGHVWLTDFGLAQFQPRDLGSLGMIGTVGYISPEMAGVLPGPVDHRSDIYSLGCLLYALATGRPPFKGSARKYQRWLTNEEPVAPRKRNPRLPVELETIIGKAMAKPITQRYSTAGEVAGDLRRFLEHRPILASPPRVWDHVRKGLWRNRNLVAWVVATLVLSMALFSGVIFHFYRQAEANGRRAEQHFQDAQESHLRFVQVVSNLFGDLNQRGWATTDPQTLADRYLNIVKALELRLGEEASNPKDQFLAAQFHYQAGVQLFGLGSKVEAENHLNRSVELFEQLAEETGNPIHWLDVLRSQHYLSCCLRSGLEFQNALQMSKQLSETADRLARENPDDLQFADAAVFYQLQLADAHLHAGNVDLARTQYAKVSQHALAIPCSDPTKTNAEPWYFYAANAGIADYYLARLDARQGRSAEALDLTQKSIQRYDRMIAAARDDGQDTASYAEWRLSTRALQVLVLLDLGQDDAALEEIERSMTAAEQFERDYPGSTQPVQKSVRLQLIEARLRLKRGEPAEAERCLAVARRWARNLPRHQVTVMLDAALPEYQDPARALNILEQELGAATARDIDIQILYLQALVLEGRYAAALQLLSGPASGLLTEMTHGTRARLCQILALAGTDDLAQATQEWSAFQPTYEALPRSMQIELEDLVSQVRAAIGAGKGD